MYKVVCCFFSLWKGNRETGSGSLWMMHFRVEAFTLCKIKLSKNNRKEPNLAPQLPFEDHTRSLHQTTDVQTQSILKAKTSGTRGPKSLTEILLNTYIYIC